MNEDRKRKYNLDRNKVMPGFTPNAEVRPPSFGPKKSGTFPKAEWDDETKMPFGKYGPPPKGQGPYRLADIPLTYWAYLWNNGLFAEPEKDAHKYIKKIVKRFDAEDVILEPDPRKV